MLRPDKETRGRCGTAEPGGTRGPGKGAQQDTDGQSGQYPGGGREERGLSLLLICWGLPLAAPNPSQRAKWAGEGSQVSDAQGTERGRDDGGQVGLGNGVQSPPSSRVLSGPLSKSLSLLPAKRSCRRLARLGAHWERECTWKCLLCGVAS